MEHEHSPDAIRKRLESGPAWTATRSLLNSRGNADCDASKEHGRNSEADRGYGEIGSPIADLCTNEIDGHTLISFVFFRGLTILLRGLEFAQVIWSVTYCK